MSGSKFITKMAELFGLTPESDESKKKSIKELVKKLKLRRIELKKELKAEGDMLEGMNRHD